MSKAPVYSFDTSALIDGLERYYPETTFPALWDKVEGLIDGGRLLISEEVWLEATKKAEATKEWCNRHTDNKAKIVVATTADIAKRVTEILVPYPKFVSDASGKNRADPFVIAVAGANNAIVVTGESEGGTEKKPKIPFICDQLGIKHCKMLDVIKVEGWKF